MGRKSVRTAPDSISCASATLPSNPAPALGRPLARGAWEAPESADRASQGGIRVCRFLGSPVDTCVVSLTTGDPCTVGTGRGGGGGGGSRWTACPPCNAPEVTGPLRVSISSSAVVKSQEETVCKAQRPACRGCGGGGVGGGGCVCISRSKNMQVHMRPRPGPPASRR